MRTFNEAPLVKTGIFLTRESLKAQCRCLGDDPFFIKQFPNGADYQEVLHWLASIKRPDLAELLIGKIGPAATITRVNGHLNVKCGFFAGDLRVDGSIKASSGLVAGNHIYAGESLHARFISAASIEVDGMLTAREAMLSREGIYAKLGIKAGGVVSARFLKTFGDIASRDRINVGWEIEAGGSIIAGKGISAGRHIKAGDGIKAGWGVNAGLTISAAWIDCKTNIFAGLVNRPKPQIEEVEIRAVIRRGTVVHGTLVEP